MGSAVRRSRLGRGRLRAQLTLFALVLVAAGGNASAAPGSLPRGDVNRDGRFDAADVLAVLRHLRGDDLLDSEGLWAADLAPISSSGQSNPDQKVDSGDLVVLFRLINGSLGPSAPTLDDLPPATSNPLPGSITGTGPAGATIHLFVGNGAGMVVHIDTATATGGSFSFVSTPMLFDGINEFFVVAVVNGLASRPSAVLPTSRTHTCTAAPSSIIDAKVWMAHCGDYVIPDGGLTVSSTGRLILGPGVKLRFQDTDGNGNDELTVAGVLQAFGAGSQPSQRVSFTQDSATEFWKGINFTSTTGANSILSYTRVDSVEAATSPINVALNLSSSSSVTIRNSVVNVATPVRGIQVTSSAKLTFEWTDVTGGGTGSGAQQGVWLEDATVAAKISGGRISNFATCLRVRNGVTHLISHLELASCNTGVALAQTKVNLSPGNWIHGNTFGIRFELGASSPCAPVNCWRFADMGTIQDSTIENNGTNVESASISGIGWRSPFTNFVPTVFDASGNFWGVTDPDQIADTIGDVVDHVEPDSVDSIGMSVNSDGLLVDFTPFRLSKNGPLEHTYIAGRLEQEFGASVPVLSVRKAVGPLFLDKTKTATIPAGTTIEAFLDPDPSAPVPVEILVSGTLIIAGTTQNPVHFVAPGITPQPGDWWGILFDTDSKDSQLDHVRIRHAVEAIRATDTNVSIEGADLGLFSRAGVVFERVTLDAPGGAVVHSEIVDSVIDGGLIDPSTAQRHIVGIQILDSFDGCATGSCPGSIAGNTIRNLVTGIHVKGASDPEILDNVVTDNIWGIWLQGKDGDEPSPAINMNRIHDNQGQTPLPVQDPGFRFCSTLGGANLCLSDYSSAGAATLVIDATQNYWGTTNADAVRAGIKISEGERVAVDLSEFTDGQEPPNIVGPVDLLSAVIVGVDAEDPLGFDSGPVIRPTFAGGGPLTISYYLQRQADIVIEIFRETDNTLIATPQRTLLPSGVQGVGPHSEPWDGKDGEGHWVPDGAYVFVITAKAPGDDIVIDRFDPPRNQSVGNQLIGDRGDGKPTTDLPATFKSFNPFKNDYLNYNYELIENESRAVPFSSRVSATVRLRESNSNCSATGFSGKILAKPWINEPLWVGIHPFLWDGRADSNVDPSTGYAEGDLVAEVVQAPEFPDICLFFDAPEPLKPSHVIVANTLPTITGTGTPPQIEVRSNPYFVQPSYDQSSALTFNVDQPALVTLHILEPGSLTNIVSTIQLDYDSVAPGQQAIPPGPPFTYHWKGHPDSGTPGESNNLKAQFDGPYTFALEARNPQHPTLSSTYRGVIHVRGEGEER